MFLKWTDSYSVQIERSVIMAMIFKTNTNMYTLFCLTSALILHVLADPAIEDKVVEAEMRYVIVATEVKTYSQL